MVPAVIVTYGAMTDRYGIGTQLASRKYYDNNIITFSSFKNSSACTFIS
jgi:hypothetical protein